MQELSAFSTGLSLVMGLIYFDDKVSDILRFLGKVAVRIDF